MFMKTVCASWTVLYIYRNLYQTEILAFQPQSPTGTQIKGDQNPTLYGILYERRNLFTELKQFQYLLSCACFTLTWMTENLHWHKRTVVVVPDTGDSLVALVVLVSSLGPLPSAAVPSVPGAVRISLEVMEDMPVTAQPAQLEEGPAGWAHEATSFSAGETGKF